MNIDDSSLSSRSGRDTIDISQKANSEFPTIVKPNFVLHLYASKNLFTKLPNMSGFTALRDLDLSRNKFVDLSPLSTVINLRSLNISFNRIRDLHFVENLQNLEKLNASNNKITDINSYFPQSLIYLNLSNNELSDLSFLDEKVPSTIEYLDLAGNAIDQVLELKYISLFQQLRILRVGLFENNKDLNIIPFVKHLCPSLQNFDDVEITEDIDDEIFNEDDLYDILVNGTEQQLQEFLLDKESAIHWDSPTFYPYDADVPPTPLKFIEDRLNVIENQFQERFSTPKKGSHSKNENLLQYPERNPAVQNIQQDIVELKQHISQIAELLFVHDKALAHLWEKD
ncbi:hypothetical protein TRFO_12988 [Tritrichomonas foetus]|uniref:Leucine Rich Repeat family protein n=1 Tax=Tritrichomonas foetus TaxID=1144522 RepID=A0A1J4L0W0_9EUKA|nr:hypothetical protein TRFO_12988 [Tritrichomonas foetus]|eukprot:OHT16728.1 hypothetical protein TRFO_12988 [Tritrichomonas foetus]